MRSPPYGRASAGGGRTRRPRRAGSRTTRLRDDCGQSAQRCSARARCRCLPSRHRSGEPLEDAIAVLRRHPGPSILDMEVDVPSPLRDPNAGQRRRREDRRCRTSWSGHAASGAGPRSPVVRPVGSPAVPSERSAERPLATSACLTSSQACVAERSGVPACASNRPSVSRSSSARRNLASSPLISCTALAAWGVSRRRAAAG